MSKEYRGKATSRSRKALAQQEAAAERFLLKSKHPILSQFAKLQPFDCTPFNLDGGYSIDALVADGWGESMRAEKARDADSKPKRRLLVVIETMDREDLIAGELLTANASEDRTDYVNAAEDRDAPEVRYSVMRHVIEGIMGTAWDNYRTYKRLGHDALTEKNSQAPIIGFVNFNAIKHFGLSSIEKANARVRQATRVKAIIARLRPTDVLVLGDTAAAYLMPKLETPDIPGATEPDREMLLYMRGSVYQSKTEDGRTVNWTASLDVEPLYNLKGEQDSNVDDDSGDDDATGFADLLYYVTRHITNVYAGVHLHSLRNFKPNLVYLDDYDRALAFLQNLLTTTEQDQPIGLDIESKGLEAYDNDIYTVQIAKTTKAGYMIPIDHPFTPFTEEQRANLKEALRSFLYAYKAVDRRVLVGANINFDLKVLRAQLGINFIHHHVWEVSAGELTLDENVCLFSRNKTRYLDGSRKVSQATLLGICSTYDFEWYHHAPFGKKDRMLFGRIDLAKNRAAQEYGCMDAVVVLAIRKKQIERASYILTGEPRQAIENGAPETYEGYFESYMIHVQGCTAVSISHMHQNGSHTDMEFMQSLASKTSPLKKIMSEMEAELSVQPTVLEANRRLLKKLKVQATSIFGGDEDTINVFSITKGQGLQTLFFDVMGLEPTSRTATGTASIDKGFLNEYAPNYPEAGLLLNWRQAQKLLSTYVKGWIEKINNGADSARDFCLRASFTIAIVTGRLASFAPNLQQVPSRNKLAKLVKRMFTARGKRFLLDWDFNASEVRWATNLSGEKAYADAFLEGYAIRQNIIRETDPEKLRALMKENGTRGDVHIQAVKRFFGYWASKKDPIRTAVKTLVFGILYGKSIRSLSKDLMGEARYRHRDAVIAASKAVNKLEAELALLEASEAEESELEEA